MNEHEMVKACPIVDKMKEKRLKWFEYIQMRPLSAPIRKCDIFSFNQARGKKRPN